MKNGQGKAWASVVALVLAVVGAVFSLEGGYVNNPNDPGGATNHGVTEAVARQHGYKGHMRDLPKGVAQDIYIKDYIKRPGFDLVLERSPALGEKVIDAGVNAGTGRAGRWLQTAVNDLSRGCTDYPCITVDGAVGARTIAAYRALEAKRGRVKACELTIKAFEAQQATHYRTLKMPTFTVGWLDHRIGNVPLSRCDEYVGT